MKVLLGQRIPGFMGVVTDTHFIRCYWPSLEQPTGLFALGSGGLIVQGPPTPRNVIFPTDTVFPEVVADADGLAVDAAMRAANGTRVGLVNATEEMIQAYLAIYEVEAEKAPAHATRTVSRKDCQFVVYRELVSVVEAKPRYDKYVAEVTMEEAIACSKGETSKEVLLAVKPLSCVTDPAKEGKTYTFDGTKVIEQTGTKPASGGSK